MIRNRILRGLGQSLNKQKAPISITMEVGAFAHMFYRCIACYY